MGTAVTVHFPKPVYRRLQRQAEVLKRSIDDVVVQTLNRALPLWFDMIPPDFEKKLAQLNDLPVVQLQRLAKGQFSFAKQRKLDRLLQKNRDGVLTTEELARLDEVQLEANFFMLKKAQALVILKSRGYRLPISHDKGTMP
jgi:hypothetical protein